MSFHGSAENISLDGTVLRAHLRNGEGQMVEAQIDLNGLIGNNNGMFQWEGAGFADSAEEIRLSLESGENLPILRARLGNGAGEMRDADMNLAERIGNDNGQFVVV